MPKYWFRQKRFGIGSTPNTWQGWAVLAVFIAGMVGLRYLSFHYVAQGWTLVFPAGVAVMLVALVLVIRNRTEGGWRWRNGKDS